MKKNIIALALCLVTLSACGQYKTENVFIITLDGLRWQELYTGADEQLIGNKTYVGNAEELRELFWRESPAERREVLMPFFWNTLAKEGQLLGNRELGSLVNCTNNMWFSYPGYNEILTGKADDERINSNAKIQNPNETILEFAHKQKGFEGKVAAFGSWDVFPYIINEERSGVPVNAGFEKSTDEPLSEKEQFLNKLQDEIPSPWGGVRLDAFTHHFAMEYVKKHSPRLVYIAYGETDDFAHDGEYDHYLKSARQTDQFIKEIWEYIQSTPQYKDKTTLIITTDHGRGTEPLDTWRSHGTDIKGADQIWMAAIGPDTPALGEVKTGQYYQNQVAATVAKLLGLNYQLKGAGKAVEAFVK
ncbi:sulfatase-like hydrolase/transferase [Roseivirga sp. UBA838]|uniref:sulfatase-like hydrolase/transferase n=1 Tax=Roseivirga sp. UBA838 TaxID=1947393 RepID=UPI00257E87B4|nr:sulfatase-like hydrolase/transferase [Roseivirga sp. UBA838]|tara:strand:- start:4059 stop:5138 length:1080 start_codon:yes stop_codon:yes gene_type:complete